MNIITHSGSFHSDELFAVATVKLWLAKKGEASSNEIKICRTRDEKTMSRKSQEDFVLDVGFHYIPVERRFDHHQQGGAGTRENGIAYATFGLVWKEYGADICGTEVAERLDKTLTTSIDAVDNGVEVYQKVSEDLKPYAFDNALLSFKPTWQEKNLEMDDAFAQALGIVEPVLYREIAKARAFVEGKKMVEKAYEDAGDKRIIVLENNYSWADVIRLKPEPLFVVMNNGVQTTWAVQAIGEGGGSFKNRKSFPATWAGKSGSEFAAVTGVKDANFCHSSRFLAIANSKEGALQLAKLAVEA
jgi:uncharacterized UPF0160 family protein